MTIEELNRISENSYLDLVGIRFEHYSGEEISASIEIQPRHFQPAGVVHGAVYISLAETLAGAGSMLMVMNEGKVAFGTNISSQHVASVHSGKITGHAQIIYKSVHKHIWDVKITDHSGKLISISRVTNSIKPIGSEEDLKGIK